MLKVPKCALCCSVEVPICALCCDVEVFNCAFSVVLQFLNCTFLASNKINSFVCCLWLVGRNLSS